MGSIFLLLERENTSISKGTIVKADIKVNGSTRLFICLSHGIQKGILNNVNISNGIRNGLYSIKDNTVAGINIKATVSQ